MIKRLVSSLLLAILLVGLVSGVAYAYLYHAPVTITENASTSYTMLPILWDQNNVWLASNGFMSSTANDTRVQTLGGLGKPWTVADNKTLTAIPVLANSQTNLYFTTGESAASAMDIIVGYGGYITITDDPALEPGNNFSLTLSRWIDTSLSSDNIVFKSGAVHIYNSTSNVTAVVTTGTATTASETVGGDNTIGITNLVGAATHWQAEASDDGDTSYVWTHNTVEEKDYYTIVDPNLPNASVITAVDVHIKIASATGGDGIHGKPYLRLGGVEVAGTDHSYAATAYSDVSDTIARPGGGSWAAADFASLQLGLGLWTNNIGYTSKSTYVYIVVHYTPIYSVTATGATTTDSTITLALTGGTLSLTLNSDAPVTLACPGTTANTTNNWLIYPRAYMNYYTESVGGTEVLRYEPTTMITGTVLPDRDTGDGTQNGIITWGSNPAGVGVTLGGMVSSGQSSAIGGVSATSTSDILPVTGGTDWRPNAGVSATLQANPMRPIVTAISDNTTLSEYQVWVWFGIIFVVFVTALVGANVRGHHLITGIAASAAVILMVVWTVFPWGAIFIVAVAIIFGLISERSPSL